MIDTVSPDVLVARASAKGSVLYVALVLSIKPNHILSSCDLIAGSVFLS